MPEAIPVIVVAGLVFAFLIVRMSLRYEERKLKYKSSSEGADRLEQILAATQSEVARLKERVQVLERLATDDDRKLADEISRLSSQDRRPGGGV